MVNTITVAYPTDNPVQVQINYSVESRQDVLSISCSVGNGFFPAWLQLRKFDFSSQKNEGHYTLLFNELNNSKNLDTSLFIDLVYFSIMKRERFKV